MERNITIQRIRQRIRVVDVMERIASVKWSWAEDNTSWKIKFEFSWGVSFFRYWTQPRNSLSKKLYENLYVPSRARKFSYNLLNINSWLYKRHSYMWISCSCLVNYMKMKLLTRYSERTNFHKLFLGGFQYLKNDPKNKKPLLVECGLDKLTPFLLIV